MRADTASRPDTSSTQPSAMTAPGASSGDLTVLQLVNVMLRSRVAIILTAVLIAVLTGAVVMSTPRTYSSTTSFLPQGGKPNSPLNGLAAQLGVDVPGGTSGGSSPQFYAQLADSRHLLSKVAEQSFVVDGRTVPLANILRTENANPVVQRELTIRALQAAVSTEVDLQTSIVSVSVRAPNPQVARDLVSSVLSAISLYNLETRQSQARAERVFTEQRLADAATELRRAEDDMESFLRSNRVLGSPSLVADKERLSRQVSLRNQIYAQLAGAYEQSKLEEVRDTPVLTVLDPPEVPIEPNPRGLVTKTLLGFIIGALIAAVLAVLINRLRAHGESGSDAEEFVALRQAALADLRHPVRALSQRLRPRAKRSARERAAPGNAQN
jgi:uncharacterized protein involved in exopolysaccharide biosynthesis